MRKWIHSKWKSRGLRLLLALILLPLNLGCAAKGTERSQIDRAMAYMNKRDYRQAADLLEEAHNDYPSNTTISLTLAQAHLGLAHFEMMDFVRSIAAAQDPSTSVKLDEEPKCDNGAIDKIQGYDIRCLLYRVIQNLPNVENPSFVRARELLRQSFPDPKHSSPDVNFLAAFVEISSAAYRLRTLAMENTKRLMEIEPNDETMADAQFKVLVYNLKHLLLELRLGMIRMRYSYGKLNQLVTNMDGRPVVSVGDRHLVFSENLDTPELLRFGAQIIQDKMKSVDGELNREARRKIRFLGYRFQQTLSKFDSAFFSRENLDSFNLAWRFNGALTWILENLADVQEDSVHLEGAQLFWKHPPILLEGFRDSFVSSWEREKVRPLWDYFKSTRAQWNELGQILDAWDHWYSEGLSTDQRLAIRHFLRDTVKKDPRFANLPERIRGQAIQKYGVELTVAMVKAFEKILKGEVADIRPIDSALVLEGQALLIRTAGWVDRNLWPIKW